MLREDVVVGGTRQNCQLRRGRSRTFQPASRHAAQQRKHFSGVTGRVLSASAMTSRAGTVQARPSIAPVVGRAQ